MQPIGILDIGTGNIGSVQNMLKKIGSQSALITEPDNLPTYRKIILPGVGAFGPAMHKLNELGFVDALNEARDSGSFIFGICLGMQLLTQYSEEGDCQGLGFVRAKTARLPGNSNIKIPHMGWNLISKVREDPILNNLEQARFYFVHSYAVHCEVNEIVVANSCHSVDFCSIFRDENVLGVQFHPEKSHRYGIQLLTNFKEL